MWIIIGIAVIAIAIAAIVARGRSNDGVESFQRQIDALSPEARRSVVDQVQRAADDDSADVSDDADADDSDDGRAT